MNSEVTGGPGAPPDQVIGTAIQGLVAKRLGRGFLPLAMLFAAGVVGLVSGSQGAATMAFGALAAGTAMLAYGVRISERAFGRRSGWMVGAAAGSILPPAFGLYVAAWPGLRGLASGGGPFALASALFFTVTGIWSMRLWMKLVEVERLSQTMLTASPSVDTGP